MLPRFKRAFFEHLQYLTSLVNNSSACIWCIQVSKHAFFHILKLWQFRPYCAACILSAMQCVSNVFNPVLIGGIYT